MEKRLILAIGLSMLVLLVWSTLVPKKQPIGNKDVTQNIVPVETQTATQVLPATPLVKEPALEFLFKFSQEKFDLNFVENLGAIKDITFKLHQNYNFPLKYGFLSGDSMLDFKKESSGPDRVVFVHRDVNKEIIKRFIFPNSNYSMELEIVVRNLSNETLNLNLPLILGVKDFSQKNLQSRFYNVSVATDDKTSYHGLGKNREFNNAKFIGLRDRYFCEIVQSEKNTTSAFIRRINNGEAEVGLIPQILAIPPKGQIGQLYRVYLGPQDLKSINKVDSNWGVVINYGTFDFISQILLQFLEIIHRLVHNWGLAIIILSIAVYFLLYPLTLKQMRSMKEMQAVQPKVEALRKMYKDNPQKLNKEIMELYKEHKVNPFGGCLPLLLQMPIFFALYQALMRSVALKGASFFWIKDLSEPDKLFTLPVTLPILGNEVNILPIVMAIGMLVQQKVSMGNASSGVSNEQQKMMMVIMPVMFGIIFYHMPSGLVLYWFVNSTLMLLYQLRVNKAK